MRNTKEDNCPRSFWLSLRRDDPDRSTHFLKFKTACKTWSCPVCSQRKKDLLAEKIRKYFKNKCIYHYTLTIKNTNQGTERSVLHGKKSFARFRKKINRRFGRFAYIYFVEFTKHGIVHYHLLSDCDFPKYVVKNLWFQSTRNSFQVEKSKFPEKHGIVRRYVVKYVLKQIEEFGKSTVHGQKVYTYSSHFFNPPRARLGWELIGLYDCGIQCMIEHYTAIREYRIEIAEVGRPPPECIQRDGYADCTFRPAC